ncbi:MAG: acetyl-CoA carboxylase biotin carboxyl carrier protein [Candidatus Riflebacteria bacterium]|nr:acetyl-CoA carboxylase biotin carboxyl carrier protein [Candidatus Riflebacteria bacterium]
MSENPIEKPENGQKKERNETSLNDVLEIIKFMSSTDLSELQVESPELKISLRRGSSNDNSQQSPPPIAGMPFYAPPFPGEIRQTPLQQMPMQLSSKTQSKAPEKKSEDEKFHKILSPMVGTFYRAPSPSSPAYVKEGDVVAAGQPVCIVEAMKLMNEIKADKAGKVVKIPVGNGQQVEKGTILFLIDCGA